MKKRIGTKLYDTDTAELVCDYDLGKVYRKKTGNGEFFVHNEKTGIIIALEYDTAKEIIKANAPKDVFDNLFSLKGKDTTKKMIPISMSDYDKLRLKRASAKRKMSMSEYIVWLIEQDEKRLLNKQEQNDRGN